MAVRPDSQNHAGMPTFTPGIDGLVTRQDLQNFIRQELDARVPQNLQAFLAGGVLKLAAQADRKLAIGSDTLTFTASTDSAAKQITHGVGAAVVVYCVTTGGSFGQIARFTVNNKTATTADIYGEVKTAFTGTLNFDWIAIGAP